MEVKRIAVALNLDWPLKRYHELYHGIQDYASQYTDWILTWDHFPEKALSRNLENPYYAGVIGRIKYEAYDIIKSCNIPVVNTWASGHLRNEITSIYADYLMAGQVAADHLLQKGFRNFINIDHRKSKSASSFYKGVRQSISKYNCSIKRYLISNRYVNSDILWDKFNTDFTEWSKEWQTPLGILCSLSSFGPKVTALCLLNNLRIPEDVAVVTTGNDLSYCEGFSPTVTSVEINRYKIGFEAARLLHKKLQGEEVPLNTTLIEPGICIPRESTDNYAVDDPEIKKALRFISENYHKNIQITDVVDATGISRTTLKKKFTEVIGHSIFDEIIRLKTSSAKRLLLETDLEIQDISKKSGFSSSHHLIRVFKKHIGTTPGVFRNLNQS